MPSKFIKVRPSGYSSPREPLASCAIKASIARTTNQSSPSDTADLRKRHNTLLSKHIPQGTKSNIPIKIELVDDSLPLVSFGDPSQSSGASYTGRLLVNVEKQTTFKLIEVKLLCSISVQKPVVQNCTHCHGHTRELTASSFGPLTLNKGIHEFPISHIFDGKLPGTTHGHLCMIDYCLSASVKTIEGISVNTGKMLELKRAFRHEDDLQRNRIFPPTNISSAFTYSPIIEKTNEIAVGFHFNAPTIRTESALLRWNLKHLTWRIEEAETVVSFPCPKHANRQIQQMVKREARTIGAGEVNPGQASWKSLQTADAINCVFNAQIGNPQKCSTDVLAADMGVTIAHTLVISMVVSEVVASSKSPDLWREIGSSRSLLAELPIQVSEPENIGIAWDEDAPPMYEMVPPSPPTYPLGTTNEWMGSEPMRRSPSTASRSTSSSNWSARQLYENDILLQL